ncbi:MAG: arginase family protein, partial [Pseudomonadota bacterium]
CGRTFSLGSVACDLLHFFADPQPIQALDRLRNASPAATRMLDHLLFLDLITIAPWKCTIRRGVTEPAHRRHQAAPALDDLLASHDLLFGCVIDFANDPPFSAFSGPYLIRGQALDTTSSLQPTDQGDIVAHTDEGIYDIGRRIAFNTWRARLTNKMPIMIGGDHSLSYFAARGCALDEPLVYVQLDAHHDIGRSVAKPPPNNNEIDLGLRPLNHANFAYRLALQPSIQNIIQIGVRPSQVMARSSLGATSGKILQIASPRANRLSASAIADAILALGQSVYLSIDLDVVDPAVGLSVTTPLDDGITFEKLVDIVRELARRRVLVGADIVEFFSSEEPSKRERTATAVRTIINACQKR